MSKVKQTLADKEYKRIANNQNDKNSFIVRNAALNYLLLYLLYPIAAIYSAFTQGAALYVYLDRVINSAFAALIFTIIVAVVIEVSKYFFGKAVSDDARQHVWTESKNHIIAFVLKLVAFVGVFAFSITLSLTGAPDVAQDYRENAVPIDAQLISKDSIQNYFDVKIAAERADIAAAERMTWRGAIVADGRQIIKTAKANIKDYEQQAQAALTDATKQNNDTRSDYDAETATAGNWLTGFAGLGEVLAIIILLFVSNYESGAEKEVFAQVKPAPQPTVTNTASLTANPNSHLFSQNSAINNPDPGQRRPIGFKIPDSGHYNSGHYTNSGKGSTKI